MTPTHQEKLREEFSAKFVHPTRARNFHRDGKILCFSEGREIIEWFLSHRSQDLERLKGEVEAKMSDAGFEELNGREYTQGYDDGLSAVLEVLNKYETN